MIEELRRIKLDEIEEKIRQLKESAEAPKEYTWFEKHIFKKKEYQLYIEEQNRNQQEKKKKIEELYEIQQKYRTAVTIQQLGYTLETAMQELQRYGINPIITESEMKELTTTITKPSVDNFEGIILIHKTAYAPSGSKIKTRKDNDLYVEIVCDIAGEKIPVRYQEKRDTIHFALNGEIGDHPEGEFDHRKYAVLIPFRDIPKEQYANVYPNDTYTIGSVCLTSNSWILVPKGEGQKVKENNPNVNVIEYEGEFVTGYAAKLARMLGYEPKSVNTGSHGGWNDEEAKNVLYQLAITEGYPFHTHCGSSELYQETFGDEIQIIIAIIQYIEQKPELLTNQEFIDCLTKEIDRRIARIATANNQDICRDLYNNLLSIGYEIPEEVLKSLLELDHIDTIKYRLAKEITKVIIQNNLPTSSKSNTKK